MPRVLRLEPSKHVRGRYLVYLDTGALLRVGQQELLDFALSPGTELTAEELARLTAAGADTRTRDRAARMVGRRPLSKTELVDRLVTRGEGRDSAEKAADWLEDMGAVNDLEYARMVVRHYDRRCYGPQKLREELYRRKVPRQHWAEALSLARPQQEGVTEYLSAKLARGPVTAQALQRQASALHRRGFDWDVIREAVAQYAPQADW